MSTTTHCHGHDYFTDHTCTELCTTSSCCLPMPTINQLAELDTRTTFVRGVDRTGITTAQWIAECFELER